MLKALRENFKNQPWLKAVLLLTAVGLVAYLGYYFIDYGQTTAGPDGEWAVRIDGDSVPAREFRSLARNRARYYRELLGEDYDRQRLAVEVIGDIIRREVMSREARKAGLSVSRQETAQELFNNPSFQDSQGNFIGRQAYERTVRALFDVNPETFERWIETELLIRKWQELIGEPVTVSEDELEELYRVRTEKTSIDYVVVASADQELSWEITDEELSDWYEQHEERYRRPEGHSIRYVLVERQALRDRVQISDEEIAAFYQTNRAAYSRPEQRRARHILFKVAPGAGEAEREEARRKAEQVLQRVQAGEDFAGLAIAMSEDTGSAPQGGDLGFFSRGDMVPPFEEAAFGTPVDGFAPVVETDFGFHVIQVTEARAAGTAPLEEVREEIRQQLQVRRAQQLAEETASRIAEAAAAPDDLEAAAAKEGLEVRSLVVRKGDRLSELGPSPEFRDTVHGMAAGSVSRPLGVARGMAVVGVDEVLPPSIAPLDEVRTEVRVDLLNHRLREAALAGAERALKRGGSLKAAARSLKLEVLSSGDIIPGQALPRTGGMSEQMREALFGEDSRVGASGVVPVPAGALIYEVTRREPFDRTLFEASRASLEGEVVDQRRRALVDSVVQSLVDSAYKIEINRQLITDATG